ncbi:UNKNOWN [Stylonychia lemnae]|uniref:CUB domain-containing protein n=1 Tax=Stylonychia lemnae TaxID=5949 RepID=A0A078AY55_STYLE|nr:UNKNOWN [Stylonychia lemnae]|eukprot:CDW87355.1 UNKNOWN [Stylonychia lemnae]
MSFLLRNQFNINQLVALFTFAAAISLVKSTRSFNIERELVNINQDNYESGKFLKIERNLLVNYVICKTDCLDSGYNFCSYANRSSGKCCLQSETCSGPDVCSNSINENYPFFKYWACPNHQSCGKISGSLTILPVINGTYLTLTPASTSMGPGNTCNYLIKFPADSKTGDFIGFRFNKAGNTDGFYTITDSDQYSSNNINVSTAIKVSTSAASFTIYYPQQVYVTLISKSTGTIDYNFNIWALRPWVKPVTPTTNTTNNTSSGGTNTTNNSSNSNNTNNNTTNNNTTSNNSTQNNSQNNNQTNGGTSNTGDNKLNSESSSDSLINDESKTYIIIGLAGCCGVFLITIMILLIFYLKKQKQNQYEIAKDNLTSKSVFQKKAGDIQKFNNDQDHSQDISGIIMADEKDSKKRRSTKVQPMIRKTQEDELESQPQMQELLDSAKQKLHHNSNSKGPAESSHDPDTQSTQKLLSNSQIFQKQPQNQLPPIQRMLDPNNIAIQHQLFNQIPINSENMNNPSNMFLQQQQLMQQMLQQQMFGSIQNPMMMDPQFQNQFMNQMQMQQVPNQAYQQQVQQNLENYVHDKSGMNFYSQQVQNQSNYNTMSRPGTSQKQQISEEKFNNSKQQIDSEASEQSKPRSKKNKQKKGVQNQLKESTDSQSISNELGRSLTKNQLINPLDNEQNESDNEFDYKNDKVQIEFQDQ